VIADTAKDVGDTFCRIW